MLPFFRTFWRTSGRGVIKRNVLNELSDDIASGVLSNTSYRNADEYMNAFMRGLTTPGENAIICRTLINNAGPDTQKSLAKAFVENKNVITAHSGKTRKEFTEELSNFGFTDESIRAIEDAWTNNGLRFNTNIGRKIGLSSVIKELNKLRMTNTGSFMIEFGKALSNSLPNDPFRIMYSNISNLRWRRPLKGVLSNEEASKRLLMWFLTGQKRLPSELKRDFANARGVNGGNFKGLLGMTGAILGSWVRTYVAMTIFLSFTKFLIKLGKDWLTPGQEYDEDWLTVAWYRFLESFTPADYMYYVPAGTLVKFWNTYGEELIRGNFESVQGDLESEIKVLEDEVSGEAVKKDLFRHLTPSQQNEIGEDVNGNLFYTSPLYPVKKINGVWSVYLPNEGWYDVKDID